MADAPTSWDHKWWRESEDLDWVGSNNKPLAVDRCFSRRLSYWE